MGRQTRGTPTQIFGGSNTMHVVLLAQARNGQRFPCSETSLLRGLPAYDERQRLLGA